jgi:hypothetical protein
METERLLASSETFSSNEQLSDALGIVERLTAAGRRELFKDPRHFPLFFAYYFPEYIKYPFADFHFRMFSDAAGLLEGSIRELAWIMFRESAKTSIAKALIVYLIANKHRRYINVDSYDKSNAESILFDVADALMNNRGLVGDYGQLFTKSRKQDEMTLRRLSKFITKNGVMVEAHSTSESVRGRLHKDQRPDFVLLDDFETNKTKDSQAYIDQVQKHIDEFATGLSSNAAILYLGNYITENGVVRRLFDRAKDDPRLVVHNVPVINSAGIVTWPAKYALTDEEAERTGRISLEDKKRQVGPVVFSAEMLNQPVDRETAIFKPEWFQYRAYEDIQHRPTRNFLTVDTKGTDAKFDGTDYIGLTLNFVDQDNNWNLMSFKMKLSTKELVDLFFNWTERYRLEVLGYERTQFTEGMQQYLQDQMRLRNRFLPLRELSHRATAKQVRIQQALEPRYHRRTIFHLTVGGQNQCKDLEDELLSFPKSINDDASDSAAYQVEIAQPPGNVQDRAQVQRTREVLRKNQAR